MTVDVNLIRDIQAECVALAQRAGKDERAVSLLYSSISTFAPSAPVMFVGLNPAGDESDADRERDVREEMWADAPSRPSAFLDQPWTASGNGNDYRQRYVQGLFMLLAGSPLPDAAAALTDTRSPSERMGQAAYELLRRSPAGNIIPFRAGKPEDLDPLLMREGRRLGLNLIKAIRPRVILANGNGESARAESAWTALLSTGRSTQRPAIKIQGTYRLKEANVLSGDLAGTLVLGLPHFSYLKGAGAIRVLTALVPRIAAIATHAHIPAAPR